MNKLYLVLTYFVLLPLFFIACSKELCFSPPEPLRLRVENLAGEDLLDPAVCPDIKLVYLDGPNGEEKISTVILLAETDSTMGKTIYILESIDAPWKSLEGFKSFKLYRTNLDADLIVLDVQRKKSGNCTYHSFEGFSFNGQDLKGLTDSFTGSYVARIP